MQNIQIILNFNKKKNSNFLRTPQQPRSQTSLNAGHDQAPVCNYVLRGKI